MFNKPKAGTKPVAKIQPHQSLPKKIEQQPQGYTQFPSTKFSNIKTVDPFAEKKGNSFAHLYSSGSIPCKIDHGSVNMKLKWNANVVVAELPYNPLLVTCFDGLVQEKHPYGFIAYNVCKQMVAQQSSSDKLIELLSKLIWPLRNAMSHKNQEVVQRGLQICRLLSDKVGSHLNPHVKNLVTPMKKHMDKKKLKQKVVIVLRALEDNGGPEVSKVIKGAIPTYSNN